MWSFSGSQTCLRSMIPGEFLAFYLLTAVHSAPSPPAPSGKLSEPVGACPILVAKLRCSPCHPVFLRQNHPCSLVLPPLPRLLVPNSLSQQFPSLGSKPHFPAGNRAQNMVKTISSRTHTDPLCMLSASVMSDSLQPHGL